MKKFPLLLSIAFAISTLFMIPQGHTMDMKQSQKHERKQQKQQQKQMKKAQKRDAKQMKKGQKQQRKAAKRAQGY